MRKNIKSDLIWFDLGMFWKSLKQKDLKSC